LDLLAPIRLDITLADHTPLRLAGLYGLDEERFRQLSEGEVAGLWRAGYLELIYSVWIATGQIFNLIRLKNQRIASSRAWHSNAG
jgi:SapC protein